MTAAGDPVEFGICTGPPGRERAERLRDAGCDYYEPTVATAIMAGDAASFDAEVASWSLGGLEPRSANVLLPGELHVVGEDADTARLGEYLDVAMRRASLLGIERVVFGSGTARRVPEHFPQERALGQLRDALRVACRAAGPRTTICLEHLRRAETNLVNRLAEAGEIVEELAIDNLAVVADGYHLAEEHEDLDVVSRVAGHIAHVHVCGAGRRAPGLEDAPALVALFERLAAAGYRGRCSIECNFEDLDRQAASALATVRRAAAQAGLS